MSARAVEIYQKTTQYWKKFYRATTSLKTGGAQLAQVDRLET